MSKIEVLRLKDGELALHRDGRHLTLVSPADKPALLAALLEDAGMVQLQSFDVPMLGGKVEGITMQGKRVDVRGLCWLLPVPEDTE